MSINSKINKESIFNILIFTIYIIASCLLVPYHEAWRDETQAWVLAKNSSVLHIFSLCASEGHPCLWFVLLHLLSSFGFSFHFFSLISVFIMALAAIIWIWESPFDYFVRIIVLISPLFLYYNAVICRIYSLLVLLFILICKFWGERQKHPVFYGIITAILFQSHILVSGFALGLVLDMFLSLKETKGIVRLRKILGLLISIISIITLFFELKQDKNTETYLNVSIYTILDKMNIDHFSEVFCSFTDKFNNRLLGSLILIVVAFMIVFLMIRLVTCREFRERYCRESMVLICALSVYFGILLMVRAVDHIQLGIVLWLFVIFICWQISAHDFFNLTNIIINTFLCLMCILSLPGVYNDIIFDIENDYSGGREISEYVLEKVPKNSTIVLRCNTLNTVIYAYLSETESYRIWDIENDRMFSIHKWGQIKPRDFDDIEASECVLDEFGDQENIYFVSNSYLPNNSHLLLVAQNLKENKWGEYYWVYKII